MKTWLLTPPTFDDFLRLLRAWRFWLVGALIGGALGAAVYSIFPPEYRARATVVVDFNAEQAWPVNSDKELFYYLERETRKLEEVAWADATLQKVADATGLSISALRTGKLELSQPQDGGWHFYATDPDAGVAAAIATTWAKAFTEQTRKGLENAVALAVVRKALETKPDSAALLARVNDLEAQALGITPEMQLSKVQVDNLPVNRKTDRGTYVLVGAMIFLALSAILTLLAPRHD
jgi:hypothetical protein